ncbi:hypothetical protein M3Y97_00506100 [Aphelenchoides bicaudatus]|nr:hypothetical protein M3Y97_00506100 [Aphelenchoides bicaudatus]
MDIRFFKIILQYSNSILGLAPGNKDNTSTPFIKQLYLNGQIEEPVISLLVRQNLTTIGGLDEQNCLTDKTSKVPNLSKTRWIVEANDFEISYLSKTEKVHFLIEPDTFLIGVPSSYIKTLIQNKIIVRSDDLINYIYCNTTLIMNFKLNNQPFLLDVGKYIQTLNISKGKELCLFPVKPTDYRYNDWPVWQLGVIFFIDYCCAFNYTDNSLVVSNYKASNLLTSTISINS